MSLDRLRYFACMLFLAVWWGGLTLYAIVVVPIGTEVFSSIGQGFVTQRVTEQLNWMGVAGLAILLWHLCNHRSQVLTWTWLVMVISSLALFFLHATLDRMLDASTQSIADAEEFYAWHRYYLLVTAVQWVAALIHFGMLCHSGTHAERSTMAAQNS